MWYYSLVFIASFIVDSIPFFGPPAWTVMVFCQTRYDLNIWIVLAFGVLGSTLGRYTLSVYIPKLSDKIIKKQKNDDIRFVGQRLSGSGWRVQLFVLLYTLIPLPSTPLFTAAGMAKIKPMHIIPAFMVGKLTGDMIMVFTGHYAVENAKAIVRGLLSWQTISGTILSFIAILIFLFIDWHSLLHDKKIKLSFNIWK